MQALIIIQIYEDTDAKQTVYVQRDITLSVYIHVNTSMYICTEA